MGKWFQLFVLLVSVGTLTACDSQNSQLPSSVTTNPLPRQEATRIGDPSSNAILAAQLRYEDESGSEILSSDTTYQIYSSRQNSFDVLGKGSFICEAQTEDPNRAAPAHSAFVSLLIEDKLLVEFDAAEVTTSELVAELLKFRDENDSGVAFDILCEIVPEDDQAPLFVEQISVYLNYSFYDTESFEPAKASENSVQSLF